MTREVGDIDGMYGFGKENRFSFLDKDQGDDAKMLAKRLSELPGVRSGHLEQYEISVIIGDAFSWRDVGPLVLGQIVRSIFPEVDGHTIEVSVSIGWVYYVRTGGMSLSFDREDSGQRSRYQDTVDHQTVEVNLGTRPTLDIERMLDKNVLAEAKEQSVRETVSE